MNIINLKDTSNKLYYIGGIVRDYLLNRESRDVDITYVGNAIEYCSKFGKVIRVNPDFGTIRVLVEGQEIDFASTRTESYPKKGLLPKVKKLGVSLKEDIMRRDFTINALAMSVSTGEIIDYTGGIEDLKNKTLRVLYDESFIDDPTRIIRGLKFAMRFGFELESHTKELQDEYLNNINYNMSYKRVKKELEETFGCEDINNSAYVKFIQDGIYKLVTPNAVNQAKVDIAELVKKYPVKYQWLVFVGTLKDLSRLPLTKTEQKILDDIPEKTAFKSDFEIYKTFEHLHTESILLYAILYGKNTACRYLDVLRNIKISITGDDLKFLGIKPSKKFNDCFDFVLKEKLKNPAITHEQELELCRRFFLSLKDEEVHKFLTQS